MRKYLLPLVLLAALAAWALFAAVRAPDTIDQDYVLALSSANRFMQAWSMRDPDAGLPLLSDRLRKAPEEKLRQYISGISNPHHQAYEIGSGHRLDDGRYAFDVHLYYHYTGQKWSEKRQPARQIILIKAGGESWKVDELPQE